MITQNKLETIPPLAQVAQVKQFSSLTTKQERDSKTSNKIKAKIQLLKEEYS